MKLDEGFDARAHGLFRCATLLFVLVASEAASAASPAALTAISGGGQVATTGAAFPQPLSVRLTDASGAPVAGLEIGFEVDGCISIAGGSPCPPQSDYPWFGDHESLGVATTDANGVATSPALTAGAVAGAYRVFVIQFPDSSTGTVLRADFALWQVEGTVGVPITPAFTGAWYDPAQSGHGLLVEVLPNDVLLAYWFAFTPDGSQQAWFGGTGPILGDQAIVYASQGSGGHWIPNFDPADYTLHSWGTLTFTFTDCDHGRVDFASSITDPPWGWSSMSLKRLTQPAGLDCAAPR